MSRQGDSGSVDDDGPLKPSRSTLTKVVLPVVLPVAVAILVTTFTPVGERLRDALFPTSNTVRGTVEVAGKSLAGADVSVDGKKGTTDASGAFALGKVKQGGHVLLIEGLGVRTHRVSFDVKRGSDATELGTIKVDPSLRLAGEGSGGFDPPSPTAFGTFSISYDLTLWLEGDRDALGRVSRVTYRFPTRIQPNPTLSTTSANRFCHRLAGTLKLRIGETVEGPVVAAVTFDDGKTMELSIDANEKPPQGQRPAGCPAAK